MILEMILIMTALLGVTFLVSRYFISQGALKQLVESPWSHIRGMIEDGVWMDYRASKASHPNMFYRHVSPEGETEK